MNIWIIAAAVIGLIAITGVVFVSSVSATEQDEEQQETCGQSCTAENNCGRASCQAAQTGTCGCGK
jgi:uncharacterized low-complexity protein